MSKVITLILVALILWLQYRTWFGDNGLEKIDVLNQKIAEQMAQNRTLKEQNERLKKEILWLRSEPEYLEEKARENLGLIKENETFYRIIPREPQ